MAIRRRGSGESMHGFSSCLRIRMRARIRRMGALGFGSARRVGIEARVAGLDLVLTLRPELFRPDHVLVNILKSQLGAIAI